MSDKEILISFITWVKNITQLDNTKVIPRFDNGLKPKDEFITVGINNSKQVGTQSDTQINEIKQTNIFKTAKITVDLYREDNDKLNDLLLSFNLVSTTKYFNDLEIGINEISDIRDLTTVINDSWEKHYQLEININYVNNISEDTSYIDNIELNGKDIK